jgi:hypothetical protein
MVLVRRAAASKEMSTHAELDAEGGADSWSRPPSRPLDEKKDTISMCLHSRCTRSTR